MKTKLTILFSLLLTVIYGQQEQYKILLDSAKLMFNSDNRWNNEGLDTIDYSKIESLLQKAIELNPNSSEARYYLGYTYSRMNSIDGRGIVDMNLDLVLKFSHEFEKVNELTPKYNHDLIVLDPYSKLTSEWGSMAMKYWLNNKKDSAVWAFEEGKKRGGFSDFILEFNKKVLDGCDQNAILLSSGDSFTIPLWYLQIVDGYRKDISVIDINLLATNWYPSFLTERNIIEFDLPIQTIDTIQYEKWHDSLVTINDFSWILKPSYYNQYLLRDDLIFLSLLKQNNFQRELYFTIGFSEKSTLSLKEYIISLVIVDQLVTSSKPNLNYKQTVKDILKLPKYLNFNSHDEVKLYKFLRNNQIEILMRNSDEKQKKELLELLEKYEIKD